MFFCLNLTFVYSIEEQFEVHLGLGTVSLTRGNHRITLQRRLGIKHIVHLIGGAILEGVLLLDVGHCGIEQQLLRRENQDMIQQRLHIMHLVGRDDQRTVSSPLVGSSINSTLVPAARAKLINTFFF